MSKKHKSHRLLINFAGLGDLVILVPLMRKLAEEGELDLLSRPYGAPLFAGQSFISKTFPLEHPNRGKKGLGELLLGRHRVRLAEELVKRDYDEIFYFDSERKVITDWVDTWRGKAVCKALITPLSRVDWIAAALQAQGFSQEGLELHPRLEISESDQQVASKKLGALGKRVIAIQVGTGPVNVRWRKPYNVKGLAPQQWGWLLTHVLENGDADALVFHGTPHESLFIDPIMQYIPERFHESIHNWTEGVGIKELRALLSVHHAMISVDTGPAHIGAAVGCPLLVFFGPTDPDIYLMQGRGPVEMVRGDAECQPCHATKMFKKCRDNSCLNQLSKEKLIAGWEGFKKQTKLT